MNSPLDEYVPIVLPAGWNTEKDCAYFESRWHPEPTYTDALWRFMRFHHGIYVETLDTALRYFRDHDAALVFIEPSCLTPLEKIRILSEIAGQSARAVTYRSRLVDALRACAISERERMRVLREYRAAGEHAWMYPVVAVIDYLGASAYELEECLVCEDEQATPYFQEPPHPTDQGLG